MNTLLAPQPTASVLVVKTAGRFKVTVGAFTCTADSATVGARSAAALHFDCSESDIELELIGCTLVVNARKGAS